MGKVGRNCTICAHDSRSAIEVALVHRVPARVIANRFGVSKDAVQRHGANHLSPVQRAAILAHAKPQPIDLDQLRVSESEGLLTQLVTQRARLQTHAELAATLGDVRGAVAAENAITGNLALVGKLLGQLVQRHDVRHTSILVSPDYLRLRQVLTTALRPCPDAARAVAAELYRLESDAAKDITAAAGKAPVVIDHVPAIPPPPAAIPPCPVPPPC